MNYPFKEIVFTESGKGSPPVVILHGWGSNPDAMAGIAASLSQQRRVLNVALPGFGISPDLPTDWYTDDFIEAIRMWLESQNLCAIDLIGHSHGGRISIGLSSRYPSLVNSATLIGSAGIPVPRSRKTKLKIYTAKCLNFLINNTHGKLSQRLKNHKNRLGSKDWQAASPIMRRTLSNVVNEDLTKDLKQINLPVSLIWGENDDAVPISIGKRMAGLIKNSEFVEIKNAGHYCFIDKKGKVISSIWKGLGLKSAW